jgi:hypothetical protein
VVIILTGMPAFVLMPAPVTVTILDAAPRRLAMFCRWWWSFRRTWVIAILYRDSGEQQAMIKNRDRGRMVRDDPPRYRGWEVRKAKIEGQEGKNGKGERIKREHDGARRALYTPEL